MMAEICPNGISALHVTQYHNSDIYEQLGTIFNSQGSRDSSFNKSRRVTLANRARVKKREERY
jgi:hypothetical protein